MMTITLKIDDINLAEGYFYVYVGNYGHRIDIAELKDRAKNTFHGNVNREQIMTIICLQVAHKATQLGIAVKDLTLTQMRNAIETQVDI